MLPLTSSSIKVLVFVQLLEIKGYLSPNEISHKFSTAFECIHPITQPVNPPYVVAANNMDQSPCMDGAWEYLIVCLMFGHHNLVSD